MSSPEPNAELPAGLVAEALQRVLLPPQLPQLPGWSIAALYAPAGEAVLVGGDFYDWFRNRSGELLFLVGDVSGKGPVAGALGMSIRKALKGICWLEPDIAVAVPMLEIVLAEEFGPDRMASMCVVGLRPEDGRMRLLSAGHPPPWLMTAQEAREVQLPPNALLNLGLPGPWRTVELTIEPGETLVLFTDGLPQARNPGDATAAGLLATTLEQLRDRGPVQVVSGIDAVLTRHGAALEDDLIVAAIRRD